MTEQCVTWDTDLVSLNGQVNLALIQMLSIRAVHHGLDTKEPTMDEQVFAFSLNHILLKLLCLFFMIHWVHGIYY